MEATHDPFEQKRLSNVYNRLHGFRWNFDRGAIPNTAGFQFWGLNRELLVIPCIVTIFAFTPSHHTSHQPARRPFHLTIWLCYGIYLVQPSRQDAPIEAVFVELIRPKRNTKETQQ